MTRPTQKENERFFVEETARHLGKEWCFGPPRENPDFIVTEGEEKFGLEVCEIFTGPQNRSGAKMKRAESETQRAINSLRGEYEAKEKTTLIVKFVGNMCDENMAVVLPALIEKDLLTKPIGHQDLIEADEGEAKLHVYITRAFKADWYSVNDRGGGGNRSPTDRIIKEIRKKSENLPRYKECTGLDDIRLLVVANRIMKSGKLSLQEPPAFDLRGFQKVYFLSHPEFVVDLDRAGDTE